MNIRLVQWKILKGILPVEIKGYWAVTQSHKDIKISSQDKYRGKYKNWYYCNFWLTAPLIHSAEFKNKCKNHKSVLVDIECIKL